MVEKSLSLNVSLCPKLHKMWGKIKKIKHSSLRFHEGDFHPEDTKIDTVILTS